MESMMNPQNNWKLTEKKCLCIAVVLLLLLGAFLVRDYGIWYDENVEIDIARMDLKEYVRLFAGEDSSLFAFMDDKIGDLMDSVEIDHGEAMIYPAAAVVSVFRQIGHAEWGMWFYHYYLWCWFVAALICLYFTGKYLSGKRRWGAVTAGLLLLHPRFFAEAFFNNKDVLMLSATAICIWFGIRFIERKNYKWAVLWAVSVAFCTNLRIIGGLYAVLFGGLYLIEYVRDGWKDWRRLRVGAAACITGILVFIAITPATWYSLTDYIGYTLSNAAGFSRWDNWILYMGELYKYSVHPLPWHYLLVFIGITAPVGFVAALVWGQVYGAVRGWKKKDNRKYIYLLLLLFWLPMLYYIVRGSNVYNGWRHFYFIYPAVAVLAGVGLNALEERWLKYRRWLWGIIGVQGLWCVCLLVSGHPLQYVYFNCLAGNDVENTYEMDTGNVSFQYALNQILDRDDSETILISSENLSSYYGIKMAWEVLPKEEQARIEIAEPETEECYDADYLIYNCTTVNVEQKVEETEFLYENPDFIKEFSIDAYDLEVLDIYKRDRL